MLHSLRLHLHLRFRCYFSRHFRFQPGFTFHQPFPIATFGSRHISGRGREGRFFGQGALTRDQEWPIFWKESVLHKAKSDEHTECFVPPSDEIISTVLIRQPSSLLKQACTLDH